MLRVGLGNQLLADRVNGWMELTTDFAEDTFRDPEYSPW